MGWELVYDDTWYIGNDSRKAVVRPLISDTSSFYRDVTNSNFVPGSYFLFIKGIYGYNENSTFSLPEDATTLQSYDKAKPVMRGIWYFLIGHNTSAEEAQILTANTIIGDSFSESLSINDYSLNTNTIQFKINFISNMKKYYIGCDLHYQLYKMFSNNNWIFN